MRTIERQQAAYLAGAFAPRSRVGQRCSPAKSKCQIADCLEWRLESLIRVVRAAPKAASPAERQQLLGLSLTSMPIPTRPRNWDESEVAGSATLPRKAPIRCPHWTLQLRCATPLARLIADRTRASCRPGSPPAWHPPEFAVARD